MGLLYHFLRLAVFLFSYTLCPTYFCDSLQIHALETALQQAKDDLELDGEFEDAKEDLTDDDDEEFEDAREEQEEERGTKRKRQVMLLVAFVFFICCVSDLIAACVSLPLLMAPKVFVRKFSLSFEQIIMLVFSRWLEGLKFILQCGRVDKN